MKVKKKNELGSKKSILINDYEDFELIEICGYLGCDVYYVDEDQYSEEELNEINKIKIIYGLKIIVLKMQMMKTKTMKYMMKKNICQ